MELCLRAALSNRQSADRTHFDELMQRRSILSQFESDGALDAPSAISPRTRTEFIGSDLGQPSRLDRVTTRMRPRPSTIYVTLTALLVTIGAGGLAVQLGDRAPRPVRPAFARAWVSPS